MGEPTRPQPSAEPVAVWRESDVEARARSVCRGFGFDPDEVIDDYGPVLRWHTAAYHINEALQAYPASALEAARREALEEAARVAAQTIFDARMGEIDGDLRCVGHHLETRIRALKENTNG